MSPRWPTRLLACLCVLCPSSAPSAFAQADPAAGGAAADKAAAAADKEAAKAEAKKHKEEVDAAIAAFKKGLKGDAAAQASAVGELKAAKDDKLIAMLAPLLCSGPVEVREAACSALAEYKGMGKSTPKAAAALAGGLGPNKKNESVLVSILSALGDLEDESQLAVLHKSMEEQETGVARAATAATGRIRSRNSIDVLIAAAKKLERGKSDVQFAAGGVSLGNAGNDRYDALFSPTLDALKTITGQDLPDSKAWEAWWKQNKGTFKVSK